MLLSAGHHPERISERRQPQKCFPARIHLPAGHPADPNERSGTNQPGKEPPTIFHKLEGVLVGALKQHSKSIGTANDEKPLLHSGFLT